MYGWIFVACKVSLDPLGPVMGAEVTTFSEHTPAPHSCTHLTHTHPQAYKNMHSQKADGKLLKGAFWYFH